MIPTVDLTSVQATQLGKLEGLAPDARIIGAVRATDYAHHVILAWPDGSFRTVRPNGRITRSVHNPLGG